MIVSSMNSCELVKEIMLDIPLVDRKAAYLLQEYRRTAIKSKDKSYYQIFDYKSKRKNNWLIVINYFKGKPGFNTIVHYLNEHGINAISIDESYQFYQFSAHFLTRYNERFLKQENISKLNLLKRFITVNKAGITEINNENHCVFCRFVEGIGLGIMETINYQKSFFHLRTFISNQMVFEDQQHSVKSTGEYYDKYADELKKCTGIKSL